MIARLGSRFGLDLLIIGCCALAAAPLVFTPIFAIDWVNHGWLAAYVAHVLTGDRAVPMFVSTPALVGNPVLVFYGTALYVALSPLVWLFGPDAGMRWAIGVALVVPPLTMARFFRALRVDQLTTACLTICLSSSVYQLTNVYTRGAVTEFFAYQLILLGMVLLLTAFAGEGARPTASKLVLGFTSLALGMLAHPPTFAAVGLFLGLPAAVLGMGLATPVAASIRRQSLAWVLIATTLVPLTAWLQIVVAHRGELAFTQHERDLHYFAISIDHWVARLWPFSMDLRVLTEGYNLVSTPFLSAPVNSMALILATLVAWGCYFRPLATASRNLTVPFFVASASVAVIAPLLLSLPIVQTEQSLSAGKPILGVVHALPGSLAGKVLGPIQFAYRLVNIVNLATVLAVLGISLLRSRSNSARAGWHPPGAGWRFLLVAAATVSTAAIGSKVLDAYLEFTLLPRISQQITPVQETNKVTDGVPGLMTDGIRGWTTPESIEANRLAMRTVDKIPFSQYGIGAYGMPRIYQPFVADADREQLIATLNMTGHSAAWAAAVCVRRCALLTNLVASRWATVTVDGRRVPPEQLAIRPGAMINILAEPGIHQIRVQLGSRQTSVMAWSTLWLVVLFWGSGLAVLIRAGRSASASDRRRHVVPADRGRA